MLISGAVLLSTARAGTISQDLAFRLNAETSAASLQFDPFNTALGTLDSVNVSFEATRRHSWALWNVSGTDGALPYAVALTDSAFTIDGNLFGFADLGYGPGSTPELASSSFPGFLLQFLAGQTQFLAGEEPDFGPSAFQSATALTTLTASFAASSFVSVLNLGYAYAPGVFSIDSSGYFAGSLVDVFGTATVTYGYTPHTVPDSPIGAGMLALTWLGLVGLSVRLRTRSKTAC